jgi:methyltransferase (TIGR00027 family)
VVRPIGRRPAAPSSAIRPAQSRVADSAIRHVSDTALWVASFRVQEGQRADAAFTDPLASILSGERGRAIARSIPRAAMVAWGMIIRTSAIDRLINEALMAGGVDTVLNLGAGLDTRPYRMKLPPSLRWIELDFPNIVELKNSKLAEYKPVCELERVGIDLLDRPSRNTILARYGTTSKNTLVITEGVYPIFPFSTQRLSRATCMTRLRSVSGFRISTMRVSAGYREDGGQSSRQRRFYLK